MDRNNETIRRLAKKAADAWRSTDTYHQAAQIIDMLISALEGDPTLTPPNEWVSVEERLPPDTEPEGAFKKYQVVVFSTWWMSENALYDTPCDSRFVTTAMYDDRQKIWYIENDHAINALLEDSDMMITHWAPLLPLPSLPGSRPPEGEA